MAAAPRTPSRSSSAAAAACSAARLLAPSPRAGLLALDAHLGGEARRVIGALARRPRRTCGRSRPWPCAHSCSADLASGRPRLARSSSRGAPVRAHDRRAPSRSPPRGRSRPAAPRRRRRGSCSLSRPPLPASRFAQDAAMRPMPSARATSAQVLAAHQAVEEARELALARGRISARSRARRWPGPARGRRGTRGARCRGAWPAAGARWHA